MTSRPAAASENLLDELQSALAHGTVSRRVETLRRVTDLFLNGAVDYSDEQIELFDEVFKTLVAVIELETRAKLSLHLSTLPDVPAALVRAFAADDAIAVAGPVLTDSTVLSDADLAVNARTQGQDHLYAIAKRRTISEVITEILIERGEPIERAGRHVRIAAPRR